MYIAHSREEGSEVQLLKEHLYCTAESAKKFAEVFGNGDFAFYCALLHDVGKYSKEFQNRIKNNGKKCDHSTAGAEIAMNHGVWGKLAAFCISGHHSGLLNAGTKVDASSQGTLYARFAASYIIPNYEAYTTELEDKIIIPKPKLIVHNDAALAFSYAFFTRMIYSCLVDADYLDTETFINDGQITRGVLYQFEQLKHQFLTYMKKFSGATGELNKKRSDILRQCTEYAVRGKGLFSLTVPTGGGKTLASMSFALHHAKENNMRRIIYVIPYTSIIEQNADVFSGIFGKEFVLEHHSGFDFDSDENRDNDKNKNIHKLSTENWDMPIVITTNVQFFESLFANKSSRCRKLHNIANSVLVFDEAQMIPISYLRPALKSIEELVLNYGCSAVLCTATQPALHQLIRSNMGIEEIITSPDELNQMFKRTKIIMRNKLSTDDLVTQMNQCTSALVILNTRKHAKKVFEAYAGENKFHLSTLMCPMHRSDTIRQVRNLLSNNESCILISTRLIEAGVDIDFPVVFRAVAGLDSILQSAGRCNREGKLMDETDQLTKGNVYVFEPEQPYMLDKNPDFSREVAIMKMIFDKYDDVSSLAAIQEYFELLYDYSGDRGLDKKEILKSYSKGFPKDIIPNRLQDDLFNFDFADIAKDFKLIENDTFNIIIPYDDDAKDLIQKLDFVESLNSVLRSLQKYTVSIYRHEFLALQGAGKLSHVGENTAILLDINEYDKKLGLNVIVETGIGLFV